MYILRLKTVGHDVFQHTGKKQMKLSYRKRKRKANTREQRREKASPENT